ncbi:unnamed protein product [Dovyalis caffra]|uniref:Cytochrome c oxidase subunit 3 n=1 Tax=Dovyalis caffra TaxID=77055 RepID=A0AAV1QLM0_9ROSI|nr:unnamed protein product [Dovyalis caffra]
MQPQPERSTCAAADGAERTNPRPANPSPWPISGSLGALATTVGGVMYMHSFQGGATLLSLGLIFILYTMFVWWRDVLRESTLEGHHTEVVRCAYFKVEGERRILARPNGGIE